MAFVAVPSFFLAYNLYLLLKIQFIVEEHEGQGKILTTIASVVREK